MTYRFGIGYDIHRLVDGRKLFLGGIEIPFKKGLLGHSDADVLLHALCDALLGAAAQPDIGQLFPDSDPAYRDILSRELLKRVVSLIEKQGFGIGNIDSVIIAQEPKLSVFKEKMQQEISAILKINSNQVNIKAKTNEGLDAVGKGEAIAAYAVAALTRGA